MYFESRGATNTKQLEIKHLRSALMVLCVDRLDSHKDSIIDLAPLMWYLQLSRPESMSSNSIRRSTTARVTSISTETKLVRADLSN